MFVAPQKDSSAPLHLSTRAVHHRAWCGQGMCTHRQTCLVTHKRVRVPRTGTCDRTPGPSADVVCACMLAASRAHLLARAARAANAVHVVVNVLGQVVVDDVRDVRDVEAARSDVGGHHDGGAAGLEGAQGLPQNHRGEWGECAEGWALKKVRHEHCSFNTSISSSVQLSREPGCGEGTAGAAGGEPGCKRVFVCSHQVQGNQEHLRGMHTCRLNRRGLCVGRPDAPRFAARPASTQMYARPHRDTHRLTLLLRPVSVDGRGGQVVAA